MGVVAPVKPSATMTDFVIEAHETLLPAAPALVAMVELRVSEPSSARPETAEVESGRRRMKIPFEEMRKSVAFAIRRQDSIGHADKEPVNKS